MTAVLEEAQSIDIDTWKTLATAPSPTKLEPGQSPDMQNVWVDEKPGSVITANGFRKVGQIPSGNPVTFCINYFKTSSGTQTFVVSDNATVWTTIDFQNFTAIITGLSSSFQLRGAVIRDKLWLTNGSDSVRTFDGTTVTVLDGSGSTPNVPKGKYIAYHDERVWMYHQSATRSKCFFSALTDASASIIDPDNASAWPSSNNLQISEGDADFGSGLLLYRGSLIFFKQYTIWRLVGYDEYTYSRVKTRAATGTRFAESIQILDNLVHFIGIDGIYVFDGEDAVRISDLIDPATASQTAFGFNQLQQPNTNNQFWEVTSTVDWNAGTVPTNIAVNNQIALEAADDSSADFDAGTKTNTDADTNPGVLQLALVPSGGSSNNLSQGKTGSLNDSGNNLGRFGQDSYITDGDLTNNVGFLNSADHIQFAWQVDLGQASVVGSITAKGYYAECSDSKQVISIDGNVINVQYSSDGLNWTTIATIAVPVSTTHNFGDTSGVLFSHTGKSQWQSQGPSDLSSSFNSQSARYWRIMMQANAGGFVIKELQIFQAGFQASGTFISKTLDLGITPSSVGVFNASYALNGGTLNFYTQTSSDGTSWDARIAVTPGNPIASTLKRYIRWQADFTYGNGGVTSPTIDAVYLPTVYISVIHNTGGSIFAWGPVESERSTNGQTINYYYRTATTSGAIPTAAWNAIAPGGVVNSPTNEQYVQFKIEILGGTSTQLPTVTSITFNWTIGSATQVNTLQNVASVYWRNRYWLSAAGPSATANDTVLIRGKKTFGSPWMLKDWNILSFARFQDNLYGGSSIDGSIYQLDTGYSKNGLPMDSYFETGDFIFKGFIINFIELDIEVERNGSYSLNVGYSIDRGLTWTEKTVDLTPNGFAASYMKKLNFNETSDRIRFRVRTNGIDEPFDVHRLIAYHKIEIERGSIK